MIIYYIIAGRGPGPCRYPVPAFRVQAPRGTLCCRQGRPRSRSLPIFSRSFSHLFFNAFLDWIFIEFPSNLASSWLPKLKNFDEKSMPRCLPKLRSIFDWFLLFFHEILLPTSTCAAFTIIVFPKENEVFSWNHLSKFYRCWTSFWCQLGIILLPKIH